MRPLHSGAAYAKTDNFYNYASTGDFVLDDVMCVGDEVDIFDCPRMDKTPIGKHYCYSFEVAGVVCS